MMIREVLNIMVSFHAAASYAKLKTVYQKYATEQFRRVALQTADCTHWLPFPTMSRIFY